MKNKYKIVIYAISVAIIAALMYFAPKDSLVNQDNRFLTGKDIAVDAYNYHDYVIGVIDGAWVTDTNLTFICDKPTTINDDLMAGDIIRNIKNSHELQGQPIVFSILNSYHQLYCKN